MGTVVDKLNKLLSTKAAIKDAIVAKGQPISDDDTFASYAGKITAIETGIDTSDATATASDILSGKTAYAKDKKITGSIESKTSSDLVVSEAIVTTPAGYYESDASASVDTVEQATPTVAVYDNGLVEASVTQDAGYVSAGTKKARTQLTTKATTTIMPSTETQVAVPSGVLTTGVIDVAGDANLIASNIRSGVSIFGVAGNCEGTNAEAMVIQPEAGATSFIVTPSKFSLSDQTMYPHCISLVRLSFDHSGGLTALYDMRTDKEYNTRLYFPWCIDSAGNKTWSAYNCWNVSATNNSIALMLGDDNYYFSGDPYLLLIICSAPDSTT